MPGSTRELYPEASNSHPPEHGAVVVYDLSDSKAWDAALLARKALDQRYSRVEVLDLDHIAILFQRGGAWEFLP